MTSYRTIRFFGILIALFLLNRICTISGQEVLGSGDFSEDAAAFYATGRAKGGTEEGAARLARSDALDRIFRELGKDRLFREMFLSSWPEAIKTESLAFKKISDSEISAEHRVRVERSPLVLAEQNYRFAAISHLDKAEEFLEKAEALIRAAETAELDLRLPESSGLYRRGREEAGRGAATLAPLGDDSLLSSKGTNLSSLRRLADSLSASADDGLDRIEAAEKAAADAARAEEVERNKRENRERLISGVRWAFLHRPYEYLTLRYDFPFVVNFGEGTESLNTLNAQVRLEGSFKPGVWLRTTLRHEEWNLGGGVFHGAWTQDAAVGFFGETLWGLGVQWDWSRTLSRGGISSDGVKHQGLKLFYGKIDPERGRPFFLLSLSYQIPRFYGDIISSYHLNGEVDLRVKAEDIIFVEAGAVSKAVQAGPSGVPEGLPGNLMHLLGWRAGVAVRLPYPFAWGIAYRASWVAPIDKEGNTGRYVKQPQGWTFFFEYSL